MLILPAPEREAKHIGRLLELSKDDGGAADLVTGRVGLGGGNARQMRCLMMAPLYHSPR